MRSPVHRRRPRGPLPVGAVGGGWGDILNLPNLHPWAGEGSWAVTGPLVQESWSLFLLWPGVYVEGSDAQLLASLVYILGSQHGSVRRGFISVSLHLHPSVTWQMVSLPERPVTCLKVSLKAAKMWHTPNTFYPSALEGWGWWPVPFFLSPCEVPFLCIFSRLRHQKTGRTICAEKPWQLLLLFQLLNKRTCHLKKKW